MPPKKIRKLGPPAAGDGSSTPQTPSPLLALSYLYHPRPFKNPAYTKNTNRRMKSLRAVFAAERERERLDRERRKTRLTDAQETDEAPPSYLSIEAPPSILPQPHYCDITGLEAPYTDPVTRLRYHDKSIFGVIRSLHPGSERQYLAARGVNPVVK